MHGRLPAAAISFTVALACAAALPAVASAQARMTLDQAAASVKFPVFEITRPPKHFERTVGIFDHTGEHGCPKRSKSVQTDYVQGSGPTSRWLYLSQYGKPCRPNDPAGKKVRRVRVLGRRVTVHLYCAHTPLVCPHSPRAGTYMAEFSLRSGGQRTQLIFSAHARVGLRSVVRALRSLRLVDLTRPVVQLTEFMSPDQAIFCQIEDTTKPPYTWCVMGTPFRSGMLGADGSVDVCNMDPNGCIPGGGTGVPPLRPGQTSRVGGFSCTEAALAITCTVASGAHKGAGFRIAADGATVVSPAPPG